MTYGWLQFCFWVQTGTVIMLVAASYMQHRAARRDIAVMELQNEMLGAAREAIARLQAENASLRDAVVEARQRQGRGGL